MFYVALLSIVLLAFLAFCLMIYIVGQGKGEKAKGGPVIRSRERRGIVRFVEDPADTQENFARIIQ